MQLVENLPDLHDLLDSTPALDKMRAVLLTCNLDLERWRQKNQKFQVILGYKSSLKPAWVTGELVSK